MSKVIASFTMSLDGFIAGPNDDVGTLFNWYFSGDVAIPSSHAGMVFKVAPPSVEIIQSLLGTFGAIVTGRRDFDVSKAWGGTSPLHVPIFIVTHNPPQEWLNKPSPFTFVTDSVESALEQAKKVAGDKPVAVGGTTITRQLLEAGLLDEIHIELAHMLLGDGIRLFDHLTKPIELESTRVIASKDVTHLKYRVVK
jgi:dihydrofolate reductase